MARILVVDDEETLLRLVTHNLQREGFETLTATDGISAMDMVRELTPDLVILDLMLPGLNGLEVLRRIRQEDNEVPVIMLTARDDEVDKVVGLEMGADDYVTKPFGVRELVARVKAVIRRRERTVKASQDLVLSAGPVTVDLESYEAFVYGRKLDLTLKEFELLALLMKNRGRVLKRDYLLDAIWGYDVETGSRVLDVHVSKLRDKLEEDSKNPQFIKTVRGLGYKFEDAGHD